MAAAASSRLPVLVAMAAEAGSAGTEAPTEAAASTLQAGLAARAAELPQTAQAPRPRESPMPGWGRQSPAAKKLMTMAGQLPRAPEQKVQEAGRIRSPAKRRSFPPQQEE